MIRISLPPSYDLINIHSRTLSFCFASHLSCSCHRLSILSYIKSIYIHSSIGFVFTPCQPLVHTFRVVKFICSVRKLANIFDLRLFVVFSCSVANVIWNCHNTFSEHPFKYLMPHSWWHCLPWICVYISNGPSNAYVRFFVFQFTMSLYKKESLLLNPFKSPSMRSFLLVIKFIAWS